MDRLVNTDNLLIQTGSSSTFLVTFFSYILYHPYYYVCTMGL